MSENVFQGFLPPSGIAKGQSVGLVRVPLSNVISNQVPRVANTLAVVGNVVKQTPAKNQQPSGNQVLLPPTVNIGKGQLVQIVRRPLSNVSNQVANTPGVARNVLKQPAAKNRLSLGNHNAGSKNPRDNLILRARELSTKLLSNPGAHPSIKNTAVNNPKPSLDVIQQVSCAGVISEPPSTAGADYAKLCSEILNEETPVHENPPANALQSLTPDETDWSDLSDEEFEPKKKLPRKTAHQQTQPSKTQTTKVKRKIAGCRKSSEEIASIVEKAREESLSNPEFEKIHENMPKLMPDYVITEATSTPNQNNPEDGEHWTATLRVKIYNKSDAYEWLSAYEDVSSCDFRVTQAKRENSKRLVFKKVYHCHHNTKRKTDAPPKKSKNWTSKNTKCPSIIRFTIKQKMEWSADYLLEEFPCEIFIRHHHNHPVKCADAQRLRRPNKDVKEKFLKLFAQGHSALSAIETYKFDLMMEHGDLYTFASADGSRCPSNFWVYKLYKKVCVGHYGPQSGEGVIDALKKYALKYNEEIGSECIKVEILNEKDLAIAICTPLMKRVHELLPSSGEMMYVDSSGNMDALNCRVFPVMTHSVAGALPLGIVIVSSESEDVLKPALDLLKSILPPKAFYGRGAEVGPKIAMTDDCPFERNSLRSAFPGIVLLLCLFHVLQAFWRFLWKGSHHVAEKHRTQLFYVLRDLAYASDQSSYDQKVEEAMEDPVLLSYKNVSDHIKKYVNRSKEWALFQRVDLLTRGNNTNNYSEATMRLLKDKVLGRTKAFNPVQLVDFLVTRFTSYIEMRISDVLNNRSMNPFKSRYFIRPEKLENLISERLPSPPDSYKVTNSIKGTSYIVLMSDELCSCPEGRSGKPCKHLCKVVKDFNLSSNQILPREQLGEKTKLMLYEIMLGHRNVPPGWFRMVHQETTSAPQAEGSTEAACETESSVLVHDSNISAENDDNAAATASHDDISDLVSLAENDLNELFPSWIDKLKKRPDIYLTPIQKFIEASRKMDNSDSSLTSSMIVFGRQQAQAGPKKKPMNVKYYTQSTICVNASGRGRREVHMEGKQAQGGGRPPKAMFQSGGAEHNYTQSCASKRKSNEPHWASLPSKRNMPAPHALMACVNANRMIGQNHSRK